jgi:diacylglycerol O-acyltransferase
VFFGLISDHRLLAEPSAVISRFQEEFEKLLYLGLMLPLEGRPDKQFAEELLKKSQDQD